MMPIIFDRFRKPVASVCNLELLINRSRCSVLEEKTPPKKTTSEKKFTHTILLPKTQFPLRLNSIKRTEVDDYIYQKCKFAELYQWQRKHRNGPEFILHDGPPYANGKPHMGHAINKILKDITIRHKLLQGNKIHYVPGWDCHGLPIELKAVTTKEENLKTNDPIKIRNKARSFASKAIKEQLQVFKSWGIMTDWNESYLTYNKEYMKNQINQFFTLYDKGFVFRDMKPVFWSPSSRTALAEAELEYNQQHVSKSVILGLKVVHLPDSLKSMLSSLQKVQALVWTTTPWSLPANQAICYNENMLYCFATFREDKNKVYLLATDCRNALEEKIGKEFLILKTFTGDLLEFSLYSHPFDENKHLPFLPGTHVSSEMGTGLVHTAPAHGQDDFLISLQHDIPLVNLVDEAGCYNADAGSDLEGLSIITEGNIKVLQILKSLILHQENFIHSYPYDWRTKEPVIIRASQQWFIDTDAIKTKALELLQSVNMYPAKLQCHNTLISQLQKRPYWCISRQRVWGVPIPVLYSTIDGKLILSRELTDHYSQLLDKHGPDFWWTLPIDTIVPKHILETLNLSSFDVERGKDILDIWFDSGISWSYVLGNKKQADLYLEGVDQFTGWFQSSLMTSAALQGRSPYKSIFVHGFAVDEFGYKMSKSIGNIVDPIQITRGGKNINKHPAFGVDTLRWWVASHASQNVSIPVSQSIMESSADEVQKIRIVSRFLMGALSDFSYNGNSLSFEQFFSLDLWMLNKLRIFQAEVFELYNSYQYNRACRTITNFVTNEVSSIYCHLIKDRLYCRKKDDLHRQSCQFVVKHVLETVIWVAAPILPFLAEEVYLYHPCKENEYLFYSPTKDIPENWHFEDSVSQVDTALKVKEKINKMYSSNTLELIAHVVASGKEFLHLKRLAENNELNELLQVSHSEVLEGSTELFVKVELTDKKLCGRCRQFTALIADGLCDRCDRVLKRISL